MAENAVAIINGADQTLIGVWHEPAGAPKATLVMLHGWSGYRTGPHQMLTRAARFFAAQGYAVLRFDFAGRGDSDGDVNLATLATMVSDTEAALEWCRAKNGAPQILVGMCSGCEIAVAAVKPELAASILWSAPVFAALPSEKRKAAKRGENLKAYARKLLRPATWKKILTGQVNTQAVSQAVAGAGGAAHKNVESNEPGHLPPGFRKRALDRWKGFKAPVFQVYGTADPITEEALAWYRENSAQEPDVHLVSGANHSFYNLEWEKEVLEKTLEWVQKKV